MTVFQIAVVRSSMTTKFFFRATEIQDLVVRMENKIFLAINLFGRSRPPDEVGLTPRQYTEWNVAGPARSTGDPSQ